ncbi:MAG TPA: FHA domain-containing protein [Gemmataceae bacterium]|jgi:pSer/pThr/pTyr-binding forkhead associated (FHA) protein
MNVRLVLERKRKRVWTAQLRGPEAIIGRALGCTIRIPSSDVSRLHCRLRVASGFVTVEDLESVNGTFLNGARVRGVEKVRPGDQLTLGPVTFVVEYDPPTELLEFPKREDDYDVIVEEEDELEEAVEEAPDPRRAPQSLPIAEPLEELEAEVEEVLAADVDTDLRLPEGGELRDFLLELDDSKERAKNPGKKHK